MKKNYFLMNRMMMLMLSFFVLTGVAQGQLYINEFMASNDFAYPGPQGDYPDWIEIYNQGTEAVNLAGYYLSDDLVDPEAMFQIPDTYPDSVTVPAGGFIVFYANKEDSSSVMNLNFKLSGGGEQIGLWDPQQIFLDSLTYGDQITDTSYGRYANGTDNWYFMADITPGASNTNPNPSTVDLYINEFMASNDFAFPGPQGDYPDWIEIYNAGNEAVMLGGYYLSDDLVDPEAMFQISDAYPDSVTVPAGGFIVFYANKEDSSSVMNLNFKLSGGGEQIGLWDTDKLFLDSLTYMEQITDTSYGRYIDGTDNWYFMPDFTPGAPNEHTSAINEVDENASISQNYPNPFSNETNIEFSLENPDRVTIEIFNVRGTLVSTLIDGNYTQGTHTVKWDATGMPAGFYFYTLQTSVSFI
ncbi:MAG: lamin tail domain-containing protein, partial [Bacteroidota bacterium]